MLNHPCPQAARQQYQATSPANTTHHREAPAKPAAKPARKGPSLPPHLANMAPAKDAGFVSTMTPVLYDLVPRPMFGDIGLVVQTDNIADACDTLGGTTAIQRIHRPKQFQESA